MKTILLSIFSLSAISLFALKIDTLTLESKITDVTVFFNGAQVERSINLKQLKGKHVLVVDHLTQELNPSTIQVKGIQNVNIISVKHQLNYQGQANKSKGILDIKHEIELEERKIKDVKNQMYVFELEERLLLDNSKFQNNSTGATVSEIQEAAAFYRLKLNEIHEKKLDLEQSLISINKNIGELYVQLNALNIEKRKVYSQIVITIDAEKDINDKLKLTYYTVSAGWEPLYDFRVEDVSKPLSIVYNANVFQSSGEDWNNVKIKLSTSDPMQSGDKPVLRPWYADKKMSSTYAPQENGFGAIKGRVFDDETKEPIPFAKVSILKNGQEVSRTTTDFDGAYMIKPLSSGLYDVVMQYVGYRSTTTTGVLVRDNQLTFADNEMKSQISDVQAATIVAYKKPLINKDGGSSGSTFSREDVSRMPTRSASDVSSTVAGVNYSEQSNMSVRGARSDASYYYIDGIKVRGSSSLPKSAIEEVSIVTGGMPANYGSYYSAPNSSFSNSYSKVKSGFETTDFIANALTLSVTNLEYVIEIPYTIPSDGEDYLLRIKEVSLPVDYVYHVVPKLDQDVFLSAELSDWSKLSLLSGKTSIYFKGTFIGESFLDVDNMNDTLEVSLGRDQNILVTRESTNMLNDNKESGNYVKQFVGWEIAVKNNKNVPIKVVIEDQFPITERKTVTIERLESIGGKVDDKTGTITWEVDVAPGNKKVVNYKYSVKYPKYVNLLVN